jgi:23S rRNA (adenine2503-C2)-methyltransferase
MSNNKINILDLNYEQVVDLLLTTGEKPYRAGQLLRWIYRQCAFSYDEMSDLPIDLREKLDSISKIISMKVVDEKISSDGKTRKLLFELEDGKTLESTLMFYERNESRRERRTVCVSTQVGCAMNCRFCATGQQGFERNLRAGEIIEQALYFKRYVKENAPSEDRELNRRAITNVVLMGMGEPLANYENVKQAVAMLNSKYGMELGARQITLSTAGLVPQIIKLADEPLHLELAISLHAATNELRSKLMPINRKYPLEELIPACKYYFDRTGRRPTFEYALFQGVNDSPKCGEDIAKLLHGMNCSVNIIVGNPTECFEYRSATLQQAMAFQKQLFSLGIFSTIRISKGTDIDAGCGQLRSRWIEKQSYK